MIGRAREGGGAASAGAELARFARRALPVPPQFKRELVEKFMAVVRATVKGSLLVAGIQGMLVDKDAGMPAYVVMITTQAGLAVFGVNVGHSSLAPPASGKTHFDVCTV